MYTWAQCLWKPKEGIGSSGTGVIDSRDSHVNAIASACWLYLGNTILGSLILFAHINLDIVSFHSCTRLNYFCFYFVKPGWHYCLLFYDRRRSVPCFLLHFYFLYSLYLWRIQGSEWKVIKGIIILCNSLDSSLPSFCISFWGDLSFDSSGS